MIENKPMTNPEIPAANSPLLSGRLEARICPEKYNRSYQIICLDLCM